MKRASLLLQHLLLLLFIPISRSSSPDRFFKPSSPTPNSTVPKSQFQRYFELSRPPPSDQLTPSCALKAIHHSFGNTINRPPFSVLYSPPSDCPSPWSTVVLEFRVDSRGDQYDRISGLWLGGAEILRTSTAEPTQSGIYWIVRKDITRYSSLLNRNDLNFTIMLENIVNEVYTGVYNVDVDILFYYGGEIRAPVNILSPERRLTGGDEAVYETPADLIVPISSTDSERGYWFIINGESDVHHREFRLPANTQRVVLELYVSFHGNDEFWYSNPPDSYLRMNNLTSPRGNGAFREVFVTIDGMFIDSQVPFPVIFTGGINPLFWEPAVAIGAFDLPTYDFDLTPLLGMLLDGKDHVIGLGVTDGISYWLVDANLHLWLDDGSVSVDAKTVAYQNGESSIKREEEFRFLDGSFTIKGKRKTQLEGWVKSSTGNFTTSVEHEFKLKSSIKFEKNGTYKKVKHRMKSTREVRISNDKGELLRRFTVERKYPLEVVTLNLPASKDGTYVLVTNVSHAFDEKYSIGKSSSSVNNEQVSNGWMEVKDHDVLSGYAETNQTLRWRDDSDCYVATITTIDGELVSDNSSYDCISLV